MIDLLRGSQDMRPSQVVSLRLTACHRILVPPYPKKVTSESLTMMT